jgi:hypothetical protein
MILLVRTFTLLQKFIALPRDGTSEAHYRLTLRERESDGFQVIDIHHREGPVHVSSVLLERALPGGGICENTDLEMGDGWDSDLESDPGRDDPWVQLTAFDDFLSEPHRLLEWRSRFREVPCTEASLAAMTGQELRLESPDPAYGSGTNIDANATADAYDVAGDSEMERQVPAKATRRTHRGPLVDVSESRNTRVPPPPLRLRANRAPPSPPIIASSSPLFFQRGVQRRDSLFDEDPEEAGRA